MTLTLPLVENLARDEIAGLLRIMTRNHIAALMPSRSGRAHEQISAPNTDRRSDAGSTDRGYVRGWAISADRRIERGADPIGRR